jgi:D-3-phosphoglycerate dehydrogenase
MSRQFRVIATNPLHPDAEALLRQSYDYEPVPDSSPGTLKRWIADADGIIVRTKLRDDIFDAAPRLLACVRHGVGLDFIPVENATQKGIAVANLLEANKQAVVEYVVGSALLLARRLAVTDQRFRGEGWASRADYGGFELAGKTLGIVGCGRIGRAVGQAMRAAFNMTVLGYDITEPTEEGGIERVALKDLFARSDVITLHMPSTPATRGMIGNRLLASMRPDAVLINAARGDLVDEAALLEGLEKDKPSAAAIDVFEPEPLQADSPLLTVPNLFLTPHIAGGTTESALRMSMQSADAMMTLLKGELPGSLVNPIIWQRYLERLRSRR